MKSTDTLIIVFVFVNITLLYSSSDSGCSSVSANTLQQIAILHRHGFRSPEDTYKTDPYRNEKKYWPMGYGQLRNEGKRQMYKLGQTLSKRYHNFIDEFSPQTVTIKSSDYDRCLESVALLMAGWLPPNGDHIWDDDLLWDPVPIHSLPRTLDRMLAQEAPCPRYKREADIVQNEIRQNETEEDKDLYEYLTIHMGEPITHCHQLELLFLTLQIEERVGYKLPKWLGKVYPAKMRKKAFLSLLSHSHNKFMRRIMGGPWIKEVLTEFKHKTECLNKPKKVSIFSAHDTTITNVLQALQFEVNFWPGYSSALIFELHKSQDNDFFVKFFYVNSTIKPEVLEWQIPNCPSPCSLSEIRKVTKYVRSVNWDKDCII